ncbi:hypothetical protein ACWEQ2_38795 [Streptomyces sp. NPDC004096]
MVPDEVRFRGVLIDVERKWATWQPTDPDSPGRIDASCILIYGPILKVNQSAIAHAPKAPPPGQFGRGGPTGGAAPAYGRKIGK